MTVIATLEQRRSQLNGRCAEPQEIADLRRRLITPLPRWLLDCMEQFPVIGLQLSMENTERPSRGIEFQWMSPADIADEALDFFPGIAAMKVGYLPIGICMRGSGDPYFIPCQQTDDPPLVKIFHDAVGVDGQLVGEFMRIADPSMAHFIERATILSSQGLLRRS